MSHKLCLLLALAMLLLCGCTAVPHQPRETMPPPESTVPTTLPTTLPTTEPKEVHTPLYIPGFSTEDVILYFREVCLDAEIINSGNPEVLQKWDEPILYCICGSPTQEDTDTVEGFVQWLNTLEGFPGMKETHQETDANYRIHFCSHEEMIQLMGSAFVDTDGAVTFRYLDDRIYDAIVCIRTDLNQYLRNSVILEEIYNSLGPIQDTLLRSDSIIYADYSEPQQLTAMDELILKLLYHPDMKCGLTPSRCDRLIHRLYY